MNSEIHNELLTLNLTPHFKVSNPKSLAFHLHDTYEALFLISGNVNYFIDNNTYALSYGDLIITNTTEIHAPIFLSSEPYERIIFHFSPELARYASPPDFNLENCFINRPNGKHNKVSLTSYQIVEFMDLNKKIMLLNSNLDSCNAVIKMSKLLEAMVLINNVFSNSPSAQYSSNIPDSLINIIDYINKNPGSDLSLDNLGKMFYINKTYLCTLFYKHIGKTVHQYITYKRIAYAKQLLQNGHNVTETCLSCGFNDYSNFLKTFKKITGLTPGSYRSKPSEEKPYSFK